MKLNLYSVFDRVAEVFNKPFTEINDQSAERAFKESLEESKHAKDYDLYKLADFTDHDIFKLIPTKSDKTTELLITVEEKYSNCVIDYFKFVHEHNLIRFDHIKNRVWRMRHNNPTEYIKACEQLGIDTIM